MVDDEWEDGYHDPELFPVVENILREWQKLTGSTFYDDMFIKFDFRNYDILRLHALEFMKYGTILKQFKEVKEIQDKFKFNKINSLNDIIQKISQVEHKIKAEDKDSQNKTQEIIFEDLLINLKLRFPDIKFDINITCAEYARWDNRAAKIKDVNGK